MKILLKGGRVIDPTQNIDAIMDILIIDGKIAELRANSAKTTAPKGITKIKEISLNGMIVAPGFIDMHTHLREPGFEYKETIQSGVASAVAGGFCAVACMPNTHPINDNASICSYIKKQAHIAGLARVYPICAITVGSNGE
ncbi:MAG: amidohydrolase family protein, partial [Deltaproteobacteria bacterium]